MSGYYQSILQGALLTVGVSLAALGVAILLGLVGAVAKLSGRRPLVWLAAAYTTVVRGVPELVLMLLIFYGGTIGLNHLLEAMGSRRTVDINPFAAGVLTIGFIYGAYMTETFRGAILAIPRGQMEAALSLGMSTPTALRRVIVPQAVRIVIPPVTNDFIALFNDTSVCSMIAVVELTGMYRFLFQSHPRLTLEFGLMTALLYLLMSYPLSLVARRMETQFKKVMV